MRFNNISKNYMKVSLLLIIALALNSCYSDYGMSASDYDVVLTQFKEDGKFGQYKTSSFHI